MVEDGRKRMLEELVRSNPLALLLLTNQEEIDYVNTFVPYSIGFEIECFQKPSHNKQFFWSIPHIMDVLPTEYEQRYRIPSGINGILCLYFISIQAKLHLTLNEDSGIHYHTDCTDVSRIPSSDRYTFSNKLGEILKEKEEFILSELDSWGAAYSRGRGSWFRYNDLGTIEYRVGEMSFEYTTWIKRIIHACHITRYIKAYIGLFPPVYESFDKQAFITYLKTQQLYKGYSPAEIKLIDNIKTKSPKDIINNRVIKL